LLGGPEPRGFGHRAADPLAAVGDQHDVIVFAHHAHADDAPDAVGDVHRDDAFAATAGEAVLVERGALAVALFRHGEDRGVRRHHVDGDDDIVTVELDTAHAGGVAAHGADVRLAEADRLAGRGGE